MAINSWINYYLDHYKAPWIRAVSWSCILLLMMSAHGFWEAKSSPVFNRIMVTCTMLFSVMFFYYGLTHFVYPAFQQSKWAKACIYMIMVCILGIGNAPIIFTIAIHTIPDYITVANFTSYEVKHFADIFSKQAFFYFYNSSWLILLTCALFTLRAFLLANRTRLKTLQQRNAMEIDFLRAQIQPHFLFNTLNNIYGMLLEQEKASNAILQLSDLLRYNLYQTKAQQVSLAKEIVFLEQYLHLEQIRLQEKDIHIYYDFTNMKSSTLQISPLLLAQLIELSLTTAEESLYNQQHISIVLTENKNELTVTLAYDYLFIKSNIEKVLPATVSAPESLQTLQRRLALEYPERHSLHIESGEQGQTITLLLRLEKDRKTDNIALQPE